MYKTQKMIFRSLYWSMNDHPEKQTICPESFSWTKKKFDMSSKSIKKDQNENWAPTIRGVIFCPSSSYVVRRGDRFFPGTLFQDRHRRPQAAGEPESKITNLWRLRTYGTPLQGPKATRTYFWFFQIVKNQVHFFLAFLSRGGYSCRVL